MEQAVFPDDTSADGIHFDRPKGVEWLNDVFQGHINALEADLLETGPPHNRATSKPTIPCLEGFV